MHITADYYKTESEPAKEMRLTAPPDFDKWDLEDLTNYIIVNHHRYIRENATAIYDLPQKVAHKHGERHSGII